MAWFSTWSWLSNPHSATITSFPVAPGGSEPVSVILAIGGIFHHVRPVAKMLEASERTRAVDRQATPPYIFAWLSEAIARVFGQA